jgi:uncharacterized protein YjbI with pentapeptide repeats
MSTTGFAELIHSERLIGDIVPGPITRSDAPISIDDSVLTNCDLSQVNQRVVIDDSIFIHCNFEGAVFTEASFKKVSFRDCNFTKLSCVDAILFDVDLVGCTVPGADFSHTSFKKFSCDLGPEQWEDTLLWGAIGLGGLLPSCYSDAIKWIPGLPSPLYHADSNALGLSRAWLRGLSLSTQLPMDNLLALYNEHPDLTPRRFAALASALKEAT